MGLFGFGKSKEEKEEDQKLKREQRRIKNNITKKEEISLKVLEGYKTDFGRGVARIDYDSMAELDVDSHYVVEIKGKRRTVAVCLPLYPSDEGKGIVRIDEVIRNNSETSIGDTISIKAIKAVPAEKVVVTPLIAIPPIDVRYFSDALEKIPLIKGDNVVLPYMGGKIKFEVIGVTPAADALLITKKNSFSYWREGRNIERYIRFNREIKTKQ